MLIKIELGLRDEDLTLPEVLYKKPWSGIWYKFTAIDVYSERKAVEEQLDVFRERLLSFERRAKDVHATLLIASKLTILNEDACVKKVATEPWDLL